MKRYYCGLVAFCLLLVYSCGSDEKAVKINKTPGQRITYHYYSLAIKDSFRVFVSLPADYDKNKLTSYPTVYLLDANFYFDIVATTLNKYEEVGMFPPLIVIGIGYKDFATMDSLRDRDYTYPAALADYEMCVSGGADKFLTLIENTIIPGMDSKYRTDKKRRILMGHSLGGYFTLYTLNENLKKHSETFNAYIAISPSTNYNHNYILGEFENLKPRSGIDSKLFAAFGGNEDQDLEADELKSKEVLSRLATIASKQQWNFRSEIFSGLGHMEAAYPGFMQGLARTFEPGK